VIILAAFGIYLLYLLSPMLTPFLLGALLAYLSDPLVKYLEKWKVPHLLSVILVFLFLICIFFSIIIMLFPIIQKQITMLINVIPDVLAWVQNTMLPWLQSYININTIKTTLSSTLSKSSVILTTVLKSGYTIIDWIVSLVLIPVVTFYLLRDWDNIIHTAKMTIPNSIRPITIKFVKECNEVLSAFFRGQLLVMIALSLIYGIGLTLVGLNIGLMIGFIGGILSIVPYLGSIFVIVVASLTGFAQFESWHSLIWIFVVYIIGQTIEGYVLTPYLVGERIGLHPVAVIFAIMAGGTLFGFFGILLALPAAAVIKVFLHFVNERYHIST
jgi:predicted PurR-regulated permease PerM